MPSRPHPPIEDKDRPSNQTPGFCGVCGSMDGDKLYAVIMHADGDWIALCVNCWRRAYRPMTKTAVRRRHAKTTTGTETRLIQSGGQRGEIEGPNRRGTAAKGGPTSEYLDFVE